MSQPLVSHGVEAALKHYAVHPPQALIISGPSGIGVATIARFIAHSVRSPELVIRPKKRVPGGNSVEDDAAGSILIEDIRQLYETTRGHFSSPQVVILDLASRPMTQQAQNAFLKLLEEPQSNIHFILATHHPEQLLPTVRSRCQQLELAPISRLASEQLLDSLKITDPTVRARILFMAHGLPAEIHRLAADQAHYERRVSIMQKAKTALGGNAYERLLVAQSFKDDRPGASELLDDMLLQLRLTLAQTADTRIVARLNRFMDAHEAIAANGNVQLQLANTLL